MAILKALKDLGFVSIIDSLQGVEQVFSRSAVVFACSGTNVGLKFRKCDLFLRLKSYTLNPARATSLAMWKEGHFLISSFKPFISYLAVSLLDCTRFGFEDLFPFPSASWSAIPKWKQTSACLGNL